MSVVLPNQQDLQKKLADMLKSSQMLAGLSDKQYLELAQMAQIRSYKANEMVMKAGSPGNEFFFIISGQARVIKEIQGQPKVIDHLHHHDLIGEQSLLKDEPRTATVEVMIDSTLAVFGQDVWLWLIGTPSIEAKISRLERDYEKKVEQTFSGIHKDEVIVRMDKRHGLAYLGTLTGPLSTLFIGLLIGGVFSLLEIPPVWPLAISGFFALIWAIFNYFEWRNDDFIVTSQRVIHIERTILHGETREEAPLTAIQDIQIKIPNFLTRIFDYKNLIIQTAGAGNVVFSGLRNGSQIKEDIFEERLEAIQRVSASDTTAMRKALVQTMGWDVGSPEATIVPVEDVSSAPKGRQYPRLINYLLPRPKEHKDGEIVWRKHPFLLLKKIVFPSITFIVVIYLIIAALLGIFPFVDPMAGMTIPLIVVLFFVLVWYVYEYDDWKKDVYIVTDKMIIDIDGSPFGLGPERRREGTFGVVQNITYASPSFFSRLINMGDVVIETAGTVDTFTFEQVHDYKGVQREVSRRLFAFKERARQQKRTEDEKRFTQWLGEYHTMSGEVGEITPKGQPQT